MDDEASQKLHAALARRKERQTQADLKKAEEAEVEARRATAKQAARRRWEEALKEIEAAITSVNAQLEPSGLTFLPPITNPKPPAIAQMEIILVETHAPQHKDKRLILNVNAFGLVQPVGLGPHSLRRPDSFDLQDANQSAFERLLADFVDLVFA